VEAGSNDRADPRDDHGPRQRPPLPAPGRLFRHARSALLLLLLLLLLAVRGRVRSSAAGD